MKHGTTKCMECPKDERMEGRDKRNEHEIDTMIVGINKTSIMNPYTPSPGLKLFMRVLVISTIN